MGGQADFIYGAARSKGGLPIIALPSMAHPKGNGRAPVSRIATMLRHGSGVTTTRNHVHFVVTEYGVADLYGKTIAQRARALIQIAALEFREELYQQARLLNYL